MVSIEHGGVELQLGQQKIRRVDADDAGVGLAVLVEDERDTETQHGLHHRDVLTEKG
jgi:hypothetical protein